MAYSKTEMGQRTFKDRSVPLTPRQRSAFILCDGKRSLGDVLAATAGLGVTAEDLDYMVQMGLLAGSPGSASATPSATSAPSRPMPLEARPSAPMPLGAGAPLDALDAQERYKRAYPIATRITAGLGLRGFRLNLAVEGAGSYEQLLSIAPKIREAVGPEKFAPLEDALNG
jgi:hypothetical protein